MGRGELNLLSLNLSILQIFFLGFCPFAKVFSHEYKPYFEFSKVFSAKLVPKITKHESFCQIICVFFDTRKLLMPQKFLPLKQSPGKMPDMIPETCLLQKPEEWMSHFPLEAQISIYHKFCRFVIKIGKYLTEMESFQLNSEESSGCPFCLGFCIIWNL